MAVIGIQPQKEQSRLSEFSFGLPDSNNLPEYTEPPVEANHWTARKRRGKSSVSEIAVALLILGAAIVSTLGVNREMVIRQFPQIAAVLHLVPAAGRALPAGADARVKVWTDLTTALYYCPGTPYYGATRNGKYLSQAEALQANFEPAQRSYCTVQPSVAPAKSGTAHR